MCLPGNLHFWGKHPLVHSVRLGTGEGIAVYDPKVGRPMGRLLGSKAALRSCGWHSSAHLEDRSLDLNPDLSASRPQPHVSFAQPCASPTPQEPLQKQLRRLVDMFTWMGHYPFVLFGLRLLCEHYQRAISTVHQHSPHPQDCQ